MLEQLLRKLCVQTAGGAGSRVLCPQGTALSSSSVLSCDLPSSTFFLFPPLLSMVCSRIAVGHQKDGAGIKPLPAVSVIKMSRYSRSYIGKASSELLSMQLLKLRRCLCCS